MSPTDTANEPTKGGAADTGAPPDISAFRDPRPLTRWVSGFVWADVAFSVALAVMMLLETLGLALIVPRTDTVDFTVGQVVFSLTAVAYFGLLVLRILIILRWFWRANKNARALSGGIETTPGWAWGFFFIPIVNLWRPFKTMEEIWASSQNPTHWRTVETPVLMRWWWGLWLVSNGIDNLSGRFIDSDATLRLGAAIAVVGYAVSVAADLAFLRVINTAAEGQWNHSRDSVFD